MSLSPERLAAEAAERAQFVLRMRQAGLSDLPLLRALELTPRSFFMPQRYADLAARDIALPINNGQTSPPPSTLAAMISALQLAPTHRVLEIGTGSGYATALLAQIAGDIVSLERSHTLVLEARARLAAFGITNAEVHHANALAPESAQSEGLFPRILVNALIEPPAAELTRRLATGGILVAGFADGPDQRILRLQKSEAGLTANILTPTRTLMPLIAGFMHENS